MVCYLANVRVTASFPQSVSKSYSVICMPCAVRLSPLVDAPRLFVVEVHPIVVRKVVLRPISLACTHVVRGGRLGCDNFM